MKPLTPEQRDAIIAKCPIHVNIYWPARDEFFTWLNENTEEERCPKCAEFLAECVCNIDMDELREKYKSQHPCPETSQEKTCSECGEEMKRSLARLVDRGQTGYKCTDPKCEGWIEMPQLRED